MATAPAPLGDTSETPTPPSRPSARFEIRQTVNRSSRVDMTDSRRRRVRSTSASVSAVGPKDEDQSARGLSFSRHLAESLSAMAEAS